jgi:hypothetical protein
MNQTQKNRFIPELKIRQNQKTKGFFLEQRSKQQWKMPCFNQEKMHNLSYILN